MGSGQRDPASVLSTELGTRSLQGTGHLTSLEGAGVTDCKAQSLKHGVASRHCRACQVSIPPDAQSSRRLLRASEWGPHAMEPQRCDLASVHGERAPLPGGSKGGCTKEDPLSSALLQDVSCQAHKGLGGRCRGQTGSRMPRTKATELGGGGDGDTGSDRNGPGHISEL